MKKFLRFIFTASCYCQLPVYLSAQFCTPQTTNYCCGFGITKVTFNTINNTSANASAGYQDFTSVQTNVFAGQNYTLTIKTDAPQQHKVKAWIDWNNDFIFDNVNEVVFDTNAALNSTAIINIPANSAFNTPLRMRISADDYNEPMPTPCANLKFGQAEDYSIIVLQNTSPPVAAFSADATVNCSGTVQFTDNSSNIPTSWFWNFGDSSTSTQKNPSHTYSASGTYTVILIASNNFGSDTMVKNNFITVNLEQNLTVAQCTPVTLGNISGYGIYNVKFNTINHSSGGSSESYQDYSCIKFTTVTEGASYNLSVSTGAAITEDVHAWIDLNNDGALDDANEKIFFSNSANLHSGNIMIPSPAIFDIPLRLRITSESVGNTITSCTNPAFGQTEDYGVTIQKSVTPPVAAFTADSTNTCTGIINFTDTSSFGPDSWLWNFGDGATDTVKNPQHAYTADGQYTVTLTVSNSIGSNTKTKNNYISKSAGYCNVGIFDLRPDSYRDPAPGFKIFPNPVKRNFMVEIQPSALPASLNIFNSLGEIVFSNSNINTEFMDIKHTLPKGLYLLQINNDKKVGVQKLVVE